MRYIDDKNKNLKWWTRNYFWIGTIIYIFVNLMFYMCVNTFTSNIGDRLSVWYYTQRFFRYMADAHLHVSWEHVLHNMLGYAICAFYIERKIGSFRFMGLNLFVTVIASAAGTGCSFIWFFMLGYVVADYLFAFRKAHRNLANIITGAVVIALEYFRCCFYDKSDGGIGITYYPYQLLNNNAHTRGFMVGIAAALFVNILLLIITADYSLKEIVKEKMHKAYIYVYSAVGGLILGIFVITLTCGLITTTRTTCKVNIICEDPTYSITFTHNVKEDLSQAIYNKWFVVKFNDAQFDDQSQEYSYYTNSQCSLDSNFSETFFITSVAELASAYDWEDFLVLSESATLTIYVRLPYAI